MWKAERRGMSGPATDGPPAVASFTLYFFFNKKTSLWNLYKIPIMMDILLFIFSSRHRNNAFMFLIYIGKTQLTLLLSPIRVANQRKYATRAEAFQAHVSQSMFWIHPLTRSCFFLFCWFQGCFVEGVPITGLEVWVIYLEVSRGSV